jgi:citrate (Re)-synthase
MLRYNDHRHSLEQEEYKFELQDVSEPNLYRDIFSYGTLPKISFNYRQNPMGPSEDIWITDTTFRDGQQARPPYTVEQIVHLYDLLYKLGGAKGLIRQCEFFLYTEKDKEAVRKCLERGYKYPEVTGWIRAVKSDFKLVKEMGTITYF